MPRLLGVNFSLEGQIREDKETASFVSYCPALELYSAGRTRPEAKAALQSAVDMYIRLSYDRGILGRLLKEKGFGVALSGLQTAHAATPAIDGDFIAIAETKSDGLAPAYDDIFPVEVPIHLVAAQQAQMECLQ